MKRDSAYYYDLPLEFDFVRREHLPAIEKKNQYYSLHLIF